MIILLWSFLVVPAHRERLQTDEAVRVVCQHDGIPVKPHLFHFGPHVVAGVPLAERLVRYCCYLVVLQKIGCEIHACSSKLLQNFNTCDLRSSLPAGARHEETLGGAALMSVHCPQGKDTPVLWVSGGGNSQLISCSKKLSRYENCQKPSHLKVFFHTYFKSSGLYATAFKFVEICIEQDQLGWQHGQFSQSVFCKDQLLKIVKTRKSADFYLGNEIPSQVDSSQCDWVLKREKSGGVQHTSGILHNWYHISTHVSKVFVPYFSDFIEACVQIASFLWK